jgi:hypothetical protein
MGSGDAGPLARPSRRSRAWARRMALEMARVQLLVGRDVVIPQFLGRRDFVLALEQLCNDVRAEFIEVVLLAGPQGPSQTDPRRAQQRVSHRRMTEPDTANP